MSSRLLQLVGLAAFVFAISGGGSALHVALEHAPDAPAAAHDCHSDAPDDHRPSQPSPDEDEDCDICLTISSGQRAFDVPAGSGDVVGPETMVGVVRPRGVATAAFEPRSAGPPRAPPVRA